MTKQNFKFLIYISYSYSIPIGQPLEQEITKRGFQVKWFSDHEDGKSKLGDFSNNLKHIKDVIAYKPDIVLVATNIVPDFITGIKVQIFHGFNAKKRHSKRNRFSHFNIRGFFDLYCTQGPSTTEYFKELEQKHKYFTVVETGWSKVDALFPLQRNKTTKNVKHVLISSTFSKKLSLAYKQEVIDEISRLIQTGKYNFSLILHPKMPEEIINKWKALCCESFTYHNTTNLTPLLKKADILLADTTSVIQEFVLQNKPVVTFSSHDGSDYLININDVKLIEDSLDLKIDNSEEIHKNITKFIQILHPYDDGKSSQRIIDSCITYLDKDKTHIPAKPLNLIRKYKIRKKLGYFTLKSYNKPYTRKNT